MKAPDINRIKEALAYNPNTGKFTRLKTHRAVKAGDIAGCLVESSTKPGKFYSRIGVSGGFVWAHRLAYAFMNEFWPTGEIDHIDQNSENNCWSNLRECTRAENLKNVSAYKSNRSGYPGISNRPNGKYRARIMVDGKSIALGDWDTPEEALIARQQAKQKYGFHPNHC